MDSDRLQGRPDWLIDVHELPLDPGQAPPLWSENYLLYVWSPANSIGIYLHLCRTLDGVQIWNEQVVIALPGDRYLVSKGQSRGRVEADRLSVCGLQIRVAEAFEHLVVDFQGGARLLSREQYHAGPVMDGAHIPVNWTLDFKAMSLPFDFGSAHLDQAWAVGHFEQHGQITGTLRFNDEVYEIAGTGLRDHSWGARDYKDIGTTTWLHGQFPQSGRSLTVVLVTGVAPRPEFRFAVTSTRDSVTPMRADNVPVARSLSDTMAPYTLQLTGADGSTSVLKAEILDATRAALIGPSEISLGTFTAPEANHHYIDAFTRFDWDGEIGYGLTERSVDLG